uniref:Glutathione hydrolase n=1 Tax=Phallusia mammillata TaxID=59560 RepID=A0A6F9DE64_9ASCI|nr:gamma-glutamyltranspeptidase 1 [Phallusia mammillata]
MTNCERETFLKKPYRFQKSKFNAGTFGIGVIVGGLVGLALFFGLYFGLPPRVVTESTTLSPTTTTSPPKHSGEFSHAAVAADAGPCSTIGKDLLLQGGSVVDAAIGTMLCVGLLSAHSCGIGGGFFMVLYNRTTNEATFVNARETAPAAATENMYNGDGYLSTRGAMAVAVPGEIAGYWEAHQKYGKLPWVDLFQPSIDLAEFGYETPKALAIAIEQQKDVIQNRTYNLWPIYENDDGTLKKEGDIIKLPQLAKTMKAIATEGASAFYNGSLTKDIIQDLEDAYGKNMLTEDDLRNYEVDVKPALNITVDQVTLFSAGPPASGAVLSLMVNILDGYDFTPDDMKPENKVLTYHRIVEAFRFAYAKRSSLGDDRLNKTITAIVQNMTSDWYADTIREKIVDAHTMPVSYYEPDFQLPDDSGTSHMSLYGENGDAVALTSTINLYFGSKVRGSRTGIIFNNEMDDFSSPNVTNSFGVPPSPSNFIKPGNRPMSSMTPIVVVRANMKTGANDVFMIDGAAGGTKITTSTAMTMMDCLWFGADVVTSVEQKRIHDQLMPNETVFEDGFDEEVIKGMAEKQHNIAMSATAGSVVQAIVVKADGSIEAACDSRKGGAPDGY